MNAASRIARRLVRKIVKPAVLWWTGHQLRRSEVLADHFHELRSQIVPLELRERRRQVELTARRNQISTW